MKKLIKTLAIGVLVCMMFTGVASAALTAKQQANFTNYTTSFINDGNDYGMFLFSSYALDKALNFDLVATATEAGPNSCYQTHENGIRTKAYYFIDPDKCATWADALPCLHGTGAYAKTGGYLAHGNYLMMTGSSLVSLIYKNLFNVDLGIVDTSKAPAFASGKLYNDRTHFDLVKDYHSVDGPDAEGNQVDRFKFDRTLKIGETVEQNLLQPGDLIIGVRYANAAASTIEGAQYSDTIALYLGDGKVVVCEATQWRSNNQMVYLTYPQINSDGSVNPNHFRIQNLADLLPAEDGAAGGATAVHRCTDIAILRLKNVEKNGNIAKVDFEKLAEGVKPSNAELSDGGDTPGSNTPGSNTPGSNTPGSNTPGSNTPGTGNGNNSPATGDMILVGSLAALAVSGIGALVICKKKRK